MIRVLLIVALLAGCAGPLRSVTGEEVAAPEGFTIYCGTYPRRVECGGNE